MRKRFIKNVKKQAEANKRIQTKLKNVQENVSLASL